MALDQTSCLIHSNPPAAASIWFATSVRALPHTMDPTSEDQTATPDTVKKNVRRTTRQSRQTGGWAGWSPLGRDFVPTRVLESIEQTELLRALVLLAASVFSQQSSHPAQQRPAPSNQIMKTSFGTKNKFKIEFRFERALRGQLQAGGLPVRSGRGSLRSACGRDPAEARTFA